MSLRSPVVYCIPDDTAQAARASFPKGHPLMALADEFGLLYGNAQFSALFSSTGQPALDPARLALILVFQFLEGLTDAQAADAVRGHLAWKYALALPLCDAGFDSSVLSEFRARLLTGGLEMLLLDTLLDRLREQGLLKGRGRARTDSTHVLAAVRTLSRLVNCAETLRAALNALAEVAPTWLQVYIEPGWGERYSARVEEYRLPKSKDSRAALAATIGADGSRLLTAVYAPTAPTPLRYLPAVAVLRAVWVQQFYAPDADGQVRWREPADQPAGADLIVSPYDVEARFSMKREFSWVGYKVHLTETCEEDSPHLITHVQTTMATTPDEVALEAIHAALQARELTPTEHLVDKGYVDTPRLVASQEQYQIRVVGPVIDDNSWQAQAAAGYGAAAFTIDWEAEQATCPTGQRSRRWVVSGQARGHERVTVRFARKVCAACAVHDQCTKSVRTGRVLTLLPREQYQVLHAQRTKQQTADFKAEYARRAGVEGTLSQGLRLGDLRQTRYIGEAKTRLQHILIAIALNLLRVVAWWHERPRASTRISPFAALVGNVPLTAGAPLGAAQT
jgi:transposase